MQPPQRSVSMALGALLVIALGVLVWRSSVSNVQKTLANRVDAGTAAAQAQTGRDAGDGWLDEPPLAALLDQDSGLEGDSGNGLPSTAPKTVRFGVILIQYRGAQGAPPTARSKDEALSLARTIAAAAKTDFKGSVSKGDPGSTDDAGRMPRGVLEPQAEYALFTLERGGVSDPVDTPRGFWIVKRIE